MRGTPPRGGPSPPGTPTLHPWPPGRPSSPRLGIVADAPRRLGQFGRMNRRSGAGRVTGRGEVTEPATRPHGAFEAVQTANGLLVMESDAVVGRLVSDGDEWAFARRNDRLGFRAGGGGRLSAPSRRDVRRRPSASAGRSGRGSPTSR